MKKNKLLEFINKIGKINLYVTVIVFVMVLSMSICYAEFAELISAIGQVKIEASDDILNNKIEFISYEIINDSNLDNIVIDSKEINDGVNVITKSRIEMIPNSKYQVKYILYNGTTSSYTYLGSEGVLSNEEFMYPEIYGITKGEEITPGEKREVNVIFTNENLSCSLDYELVFTFKKGIEEVLKPKIIGGFIDNKLLLNDENMANVSMNITNLYDCAKEISISVLDPDIIIMSEAKKLLNKDATDEVNFIIKLNKNYIEPINTSIIVSTKSGETYNVGEIILYKE